MKISIRKPIICKAPLFASRGPLVFPDERRYSPAISACCPQVGLMAKRPCAAVAMERSFRFSRIRGNHVRNDHCPFERQSLPLYTFRTEHWGDRSTSVGNQKRLHQDGAFLPMNRSAFASRNGITSWLPCSRPWPAPRSSFSPTPLTPGF